MYFELDIPSLHNSPSIYHARFTHAINSLTFIIRRPHPPPSIHLHPPPHPLPTNPRRAPPAHLLVLHTRVLPPPHQHLVHHGPLDHNNHPHPTPPAESKARPFPIRHCASHPSQAVLSHKQPAPHYPTLTEPLMDPPRPPDGCGQLARGSVDGRSPSRGTRLVVSLSA